MAINGVFAGNRPFANFVSFGRETLEASNVSRTWFARLNKNCWGRETPSHQLGEEPTMLIEGETQDFAWNLVVTRAWADRDELPERHKPWTIGNDLNPLRIRAEHWTVNAIWPTTVVRGKMLDKQRGVVHSIDGHGYREISFGRWAFCFGGWDFYFFSVWEQKIQVSLQTYHFDTSDLDFLDVDFIDPADGKTRAVRFSAKNAQLGWEHESWKWDRKAKQVLPLDVHVVGRNAEYEVDITAEIGDQHYPMLSNLTIATKVFVIDCLFPKFSGEIRRATTGEVLYAFKGIQGGGEFALPRSVLNDALAFVLEPYLEAYFRQMFSHPFPIL